MEEGRGKALRLVRGLEAVDMPNCEVCRVASVDPRVSELNSVGREMTKCCTERMAVVVDVIRSSTRCAEGGEEGIGESCDLLEVIPGAVEVSRLIWSTIFHLLHH